ncbi:MAG: hypothetical protein ACJAVJ_001316, partial [Planctomycetota bacterium]
MNQSSSDEQRPNRKTFVPKQLRSGKWAAVAVVGCVAVIVGGYQVLEYYGRRTLLTQE